ncbi:hypothetical protein AcV7_003951 [Taiwanofungus camphoratus]|nr:hypothetical protein AcV7_003951 [Antrodia cinnamomea]
MVATDKMFDPHRLPLDLDMPNKSATRWYDEPISIHWDQITGERRAMYTEDTFGGSQAHDRQHTSRIAHAPHHRCVNPSNSILRNRYEAMPHCIHIPPPRSPETTRKSNLSGRSPCSPHCYYPTPPTMPMISPRGSPGWALNSDGHTPCNQHFAVIHWPPGTAGLSFPAGISPAQTAVPLQTVPQVQMTTPMITPAHPATPIQTTTPVQTLTPLPLGIQSLTSPAVVHAPATLSGGLGGIAGWVPHPFPHPSIPVSTFWGSNMFVGARAWPTTPLDANAVTRLTGGWPLPGTAPGWSPGVWPLPSQQIIGWTYPTVILCPWLIPNPGNPSVPHTQWDITQSPSTAKRITGRNLVTELSPKFGDHVTFPPTQVVHIHCYIGMARDLWGPIVVKNRQAVNVGDILFAIYDYYQTSMSEEEVEFVSSLRPENHARMTDACYRRCLRTPALPGYELRQGIKRVDCLGKSTTFWGMWITQNADHTWQMNLGLVPMGPA